MLLASLSFSPPLLSTTTTTVPPSPTTTATPKPSPPSPPPPPPRSLSFRTCKSLTQIQTLHSQITKEGLTHNSCIVSSLIASLSELATPESLDHAHKALKEYIHRNGANECLESYNSLIRGYSFAGLGDASVKVFIEMLEWGVLPNKYSFPFLLSGCTKKFRFHEGIQVHGGAIKMGLGDNVFVGNSLVHFYFECGEVEYGRKVFDKMSERNVVSWTSLICGYARNDRPAGAVWAFFDMVEAGVEPNEVTMVCVISACAKVRNIKLAEKVQGYVDAAGLEFNTKMVNALVDMYMKCGAFDAAKRIFDECVEKNLVLYNTVMSNYARQGMACEAVATLEEMLQNSLLLPDRVVMLSAISACSQLGDILFGKCCHGYVLRNGLEDLDNICNALIDMYMKCGKPELASRIFEIMSVKTVVSWNSMIAGYVKNNDIKLARKFFCKMPERDLVSWNTMIAALVQDSSFEEAIEHFRSMQQEGITADKVTLVGVASACGYLGALDLAKWVHCYIEKNGIECDMQLATTLIDMFGRCGDPQSAMLVFEKMEKKDVSAWTAIVGAMAMGGNGKRAVVLFSEMLEEGVKPDEVIFVGLLTACSHSGLVDQGWQFFRSMEEKHGIAPLIVHYGCMVDLLGRAGLLKEALDFINNMPVEPNDVIWCSLLAACRTHKNADMAAYAAEKMYELISDKTGIPVLLSNIYALEGKWRDVAKVRLQMKEKGIQKLPGSSSVEINGIIHEFTSGDESHHEMNRIASMLHEINRRLEEFGHVPDLTNVLLDVDDQEKEFLLSRHSEKLAIAFALISTDQQTPIRVVKNLRTCSDCHTFAKSVSKMYNREIIIRDNNRFHFFRQGQCSCCDFW